MYRKKLARWYRSHDEGRWTAECGANVDPIPTDSIRRKCRCNRLKAAKRNTRRASRTNAISRQLLSSPRPGAAKCSFTLFSRGSSDQFARVCGSLLQEETSALCFSRVLYKIQSKAENKTIIWIKSNLFQNNYLIILYKIFLYKQMYDWYIYLKS